MSVVVTSLEVIFEEEGGSSSSNFFQKCLMVSLPVSLFVAFLTHPPPL